MSRYEAGETLASIARTYDCSPPAISYIVSRSRARQPGGEPEVLPVAAEPQLVKAQSGETEPAIVAPASPPTIAEIRPSSLLLGDRRSEDRPREGNGIARNGGDRPLANGLASRLPQSRPQAGPQPGLPLNGEHRRTLHLSLGGNGNGANGHNGAGDPPGRDPVRSAPPIAEGEHAFPTPHYQPQYPAQQAPGPRDVPVQNSHREQPPRYGFSQAAPERVHPEAQAARSKDGGAFIDQELRTRVDGDIAVFLAAFDAALAGDTQESRSALREATDRLLRAGARTRIELERLEARVPLTPRDSGGRGQPVWRQR